MADVDGRPRISGRAVVVVVAGMRLPQRVEDMGAPRSVESAQSGTQDGSA